MALINCPECHNQVEDNNTYCPNCGYDINKKSTTTLSIIGFGITLISSLLCAEFYLFFIVFVIFGLALCVSNIFAYPKTKHILDILSFVISIIPFWCVWVNYFI